VELPGLVVSPLPIASVQTMKYLSVCSALPRIDKEIEPMMIAADRGDHQDGIGLFRV
jgi:hypothetical protein